MLDLLASNYLAIRRNLPKTPAHEAFRTARSDAQRNRESHMRKRVKRLGHGDVLRKDGRTFVIAIVDDDNCDAPWDREDGHGPVTDWTTRGKNPGEMILNSDRQSHRYYDFQEAVKIALRDGWNAEPYDTIETKRQRAARAAMADFDRLQRWCSDHWRYVGVVLFEMPRDGEYRNPEEYANSQPFSETEHWALWGIESDCEDCLSEVAIELFKEI